MPSSADRRAPTGPPGPPGPTGSPRRTFARARAWLALATLLALGSAIGWVLPAMALDWQPAHAFDQPWRWWSAAFVHWSALHLGANLAGLVLVAALGHAAGAPAPVALAWALAWPLTHGALLAEPALAHYGGLSGVLHAGVAAAATWLLWSARGRRRAVGAALAAGVLAKVGLEAPWAGPLAVGGGWDIAVAPLAHAAGALAGTSCTLATLAIFALWPARRHP
jgi:rhomboid family GlyGly-CTERM serine protease